LIQFLFELHTIDFKVKNIRVGMSLCFQRERTTGGVSMAGG
jgi:hypothetical protein